MSSHKPSSLISGRYVWPTFCENVIQAKESCPNPVALLGCKSLLEISSRGLAFETGIAVTDVVAQVESTKRHESQSLCSLGDWKSPNPGHPLAQILKVSSTVQLLLHLFYPVCVFKGVCRAKRSQACRGGRHLCGIPTYSLQHTTCTKKMRNKRWQCCNET